MDRGEDEKGEAKFEVKFYSGYRGEETPRSVVVGRKEFRIDKIMDRKRVLNQETGEKSEIFICRMEGELVRIERFESGKWSLSFLEKNSR